MFASNSNEVESRYLPEKVTSLQAESKVVCKNLLCRKYDAKNLLKQSNEVDLLDNTVSK